MRSRPVRGRRSRACHVAAFVRLMLHRATLLPAHLDNTLQEVTANANRGV